MKNREKITFILALLAVLLSGTAEAAQTPFAISSMSLQDSILSIHLAAPEKTQIAVGLFTPEGRFADAFLPSAGEG